MGFFGKPLLTDGGFKYPYLSIDRVFEKHMGLVVSPLMMEVNIARSLNDKNIRYKIGNKLQLLWNHSPRKGGR